MSVPMEDSQLGPETLHRRLLLLLMVGVVGSVGVLFLLLWIQGLPGLRHDAYLATANVQNIYSRLRYYDHVKGALPLATDMVSGNPVSWRVAIVVQESAWRNDAADSFEYDRTKPWNDPANLQLQSRGTLLFGYAQVEVHHDEWRAEHGAYTTYFKAVTGRDTAFDTGRVSLGRLPASLILVLRIERSDTHWMAPGDLDVDQLVASDETKQLLLGKAGYVVLFVDGPWVLSKNTPMEDLCKFFTVTGAITYDRQQLLGRYRIL